MKNRVQIVLAIAFLMLASCVKPEQIDDLQNQIDALKTGQIATIENQIANINGSIAKLESMDSELKGYISTLQTQQKELQSKDEALTKSISDLKTELSGKISEEKEAVLAKLDEYKNAVEGKLNTINTSLGSLQSKDTELEGKIGDLKTYVDGQLKKNTDWVNATFATLEQYNSLCSTVAGIEEELKTINTTISNLAKTVSDNKAELVGMIDSLGEQTTEAIKTAVESCESSIATAKSEITSAYTSAIASAIAASESSMKTWVNEQLTGYYTIAEIEAKLETLKKAQEDGDDTLAEDIENLESALETAKSEIKTAYEKAISDAIVINNGTINEKIAADIKTASDALQGQIDEIKTKISGIETRLGLVEDSLDKILGRIQSIVVVPTYPNGRVHLKDYEDTEVYFEISPRSAAIALAEQDLSVFSLDVVNTTTKASMLTNIPIKEVTDNGEFLVVTVDATRIDADYFYNWQSMSMRLKIDDGNNSMTSNYAPVFYDSIITPLSEIRALLNNEASVTLGSDVYVKAEVISNPSMTNFSSRVLIAQDNTAGMYFYCSAVHEYGFGDVVIINLSNCTLKYYNDLMEIDALPVANIKKIGSKEIEPIEISTTDFLANNYESRYVAIKNVQVNDADLGKTWVVNNAATSINIDCSNGDSFVLYSSKTAQYGSETVPEGSGTIYGISTRYKSLMELVFTQETDRQGLTGDRFQISEYTYSLSLGTGTKVSTSTGSMLWEDGDKIVLSDGSLSDTFTIGSEYAGQSTAQVTTKKTFGQTIHCFSPASLVSKEEEVFSISVPENQSNSDINYIVTTGSSSDTYITMIQRTAIFNVKLSSAIKNLDYIQLTCEGDPIAGNLIVDTSNDSHQVGISGTGYTVRVPANDSNEYNFTILPASITKLTLGFYTKDGKYAEKVSEKAYAFVAGNKVVTTIDPSTVFVEVSNSLEPEEDEILYALTNDEVVASFSSSSNTSAGYKDFSFSSSCGDWNGNVWIPATSSISYIQIRNKSMSQITSPEYSTNIKRVVISVNEVTLKRDFYAIPVGTDLNTDNYYSSIHWGNNYGHTSCTASTTQNIAMKISDGVKQFTLIPAGGSVYIDAIYVFCEK